MTLLETTKSILVANAILVAGWELAMVAVWLCGGPKATFSHAIWEWRLTYPWFALTVTVGASVLLWHFFIGWKAAAS